MIKEESIIKLIVFRLIKQINIHLIVNHLKDLEIMPLESYDSQVEFEDSLPPLNTSEIIEKNGPPDTG